MSEENSGKMDSRTAFAGLIAGALLGTSLTHYFSNRRFEEELQDNLSQNVVEAEIVQRQPLNSNEVPIPVGIAGDDAFLMVYVDDIGGKSYKLPVSTREYFKFKQMTHRKRYPADFVNFVTYDNRTIRADAEYMTKDLSSLEAKAQQLLHFVHRQIYDATIEDKEDYVRYPLETLIERNGDCEDVAILGAALMKSIGSDGALIRFPPKEGERAGHVGLGIKGDFSGRIFNVDGKKYFYAETTGTEWLTNPATWKIGEMPPEYIS